MLYVTVKIHLSSLVIYYVKNGLFLTGSKEACHDSAARSLAVSWCGTQWSNFLVKPNASSCISIVVGWTFMLSVNSCMDGFGFILWPHFQRVTRVHICLIMTASVSFPCNAFVEFIHQKIQHVHFITHRVTPSEVFLQIMYTEKYRAFFMMSICMFYWRTIPDLITITLYIPITPSNVMLV